MIDDDENTVIPTVIFLLQNSLTMIKQEWSRFICLVLHIFKPDGKKEEKQHNCTAALWIELIVYDKNADLCK